MDEVELDRRRKAAIIAAAVLVICGILSIVLSAVSVGVVENLPVFSRSTINYGVQGSQLFQTSEVKSELRKYLIDISNVTNCQVEKEFSVRRSDKIIHLCVGKKEFYVVLSQAGADIKTENTFVFTLGEWKRFNVKVFDFMQYLLTNANCKSKG